MRKYSRKSVQGENGCVTIRFPNFTDAVPTPTFSGLNKISIHELHLLDLLMNDDEFRKEFQKECKKKDFIDALQGD